MNFNKKSVHVKTISRRKATIGNLIYQYSSAIVPIVHGILLVPLYLKFINIRLYGAWLATGNIISWFLLFDPGVANLLRQQVAQFYGEKQYDMIGQAVGTSVLLSFILSIFPLLIGFGLCPLLPGWFSLTGTEAEVLKLSFMLAAVSVTTLYLSSSFIAAQQGLQRSLSFTVIYLFGWLLGLGITIWGLFNGWGLISIPAGYLVRGLVWLVLSVGFVWFILSKELQIKVMISKRYIRKIGGLVSWMFLQRISQLLSTSSDAFLVGVILGPEKATIMVLTKRIWELLRLFGARFAGAFMPGLAHLYGEGKKQRFQQIVINVLRMGIWVISLCIVVGVATNEAFVKLWVGHEFYAGFTFVVLMGIALFALVYASTLQQVLFSAAIIKGPSIALAAGDFVRLGLLVGLIYWLGFKGIPLATIITVAGVLVIYLIRAAGKPLYGSNKKSLRHSLKSLVAVAAAVLIGAALSLNIKTETWFGLFVIAALAAGCQLLSLYLLDADFRTFAHAPRKWIRVIP